MDWVTRILWIAIALLCALNIINLFRVIFMKDLTTKRKLLFASIVVIPSIFLLYESILGLAFPATLQVLVTDGIPRPALLAIGFALLLFVGIPLACFSREYAALSEVLDARKSWWQFSWGRKRAPKPWGYFFIGIIVTLVSLDIIVESILN